MTEEVKHLAFHFAYMLIHHGKWGDFPAEIKRAAFEALLENQKDLELATFAWHNGYQYLKEGEGLWGNLGDVDKAFQNPIIPGHVIETFNQSKREYFQNRAANRVLRKNPKKTWIYIMLDEGTGLYKIGRSKNPTVREKTLQSEKPSISLIHKWEGTENDETTLHDRFAEKRVRGEWFRIEKDDIAEIRGYFEAKEAA